MRFMLAGDATKAQVLALPQAQPYLMWGDFQEAPFNVVWDEFDDPSVVPPIPVDASDEEGDLEYEYGEAVEAPETFDVSEGERKLASKPTFEMPCKDSAPESFTDETSEVEGEAEGEPDEGDSQDESESEGEGGNDEPPMHMVAQVGVEGFVPFDDAYTPRAEALGQAVLEQAVAVSDERLAAGMEVLKNDATAAIKAGDVAVTEAVLTMIDQNIALLRQEMSDTFDAKLESFTPETNSNTQVIARIDLKLPNTPDFKSFDGLAHSCFPRLLKNVARGQHVYLPGPPGSSKSHSAAMVAEMIGWRFGSISLGPTTPESRLMGGMDANGKFHTTSLTDGVEYAMLNPETGFVFILDEMDNGHPGNLATLNSLMANGWITLPDGRTLTVGRNLVFIGCANTYGTGPTAAFAGRNRLDAATLDRFSYLPWDTDRGLESALVNGYLADQPGLATDWLSVWNTARDNVANHGLQIFVTMRGAINGAIALATGDGIEEVLMETLGYKIPEDQWKKVNPL